MSDSFDVVIIGGAVMGWSAAWWLSRLSEGRLRIAVIERDPTYAHASTALSVASIRHQFSTDINVRISLFGTEFIEDIRHWTDGHVTDLGFRRNGYLFLAGAGTQEALRAAVDVQHRAGAETELLSTDEIAARFPWLVLDGIALGSFGGAREGWFDNMGLLAAFRTGARERGVTFLRGEVDRLVHDKGRVTGVTLADGRQIACGACVNAAGTRAADLLRSIGEDLPVEPRKRTVFLIDTPNMRAPDAPLLVDPTGFYLRPEQDRWITAIVPEDDGPCAADDFEPDHHLFEDLLWPRLYARAPGFDAVKVTGVWAGHYAYNTLDQNAIIGAYPGLHGLYLMNGFSGHGLQQSPAMGRGLAELILHGAYRTLDLSDLSVERVLKGRPFQEATIV